MQAGGQRFDPAYLHHGLIFLYGDIAQLGEHLLCKQGVSGSIPLISTIWFGSCVVTQEPFFLRLKIRYIPNMMNFSR